MREIGIGQERRGVSVPVTVPAPHGGWNTRDAESAMPVEDAVILDNFIPSVGKVESRWGYISSATGASSNVESMFSYEAGSVKELISASGSNIYKGNSGALTSIGSGFGSARWDGVNFNANLLLVNGTDTPQKFDGSTLSALTITGSGLTPSQLNGVMVFKSFVFYWDDATQDFWYGGVNAIEGAFTKFPLSRVGTFGGNLVKIITWNIDGGDGVDDLCVFFMSSGETIVYKGTDPASDFELVGVYKIGQPISKRVITKLASDIAIINNSDFVLFSEVFRKGGIVSSSSKLSGAIRDAARTYGNLFGWQALDYQKGNLLIVNVPLATNSKYHQYIVNTITGAAARFTGIDARCWCVHDKDLYFGGNTVINKADSGFKDGTVEIKVDAQQAYSTLGVQSSKTINTIDPVHTADGNVTVDVDMGYDFGRSTLAQTIASESTGTQWGSDWGSVWSPEAVTRTQNYLSSGQGTYVSIRLKSAFLGQQMSWFSTYYNFNIDAV
jgi:hypothetical protein